MLSEMQLTNWVELDYNDICGTIPIMKKNVKTRRYNSPRREQQAQATRAAIIDAARHMFIEDGYGATSIQAIAEVVGVSEATIYAHFENKASLLWAAIIHAVTGEGEDPTAAFQKDFVQAVQSEPDPHKRARMLIQASRQSWERGAADLEVVLVRAADADPRLTEMAEKAAQGRLEAYREALGLVLANHQMKSGVEFDEVAELVWALDSPQVYRALVRDRGWSPEKYEHWIMRIIERTLFPELE
jgi:TetR/AcrR family transcriptional regulator, regulator of autoinduction and epiphytic fitness